MLLCSSGVHIFLTCNKCNTIPSLTQPCFLPCLQSLCSGLAQSLNPSWAKTFVIGECSNLSLEDLPIHLVYGSCQAACRLVLVAGEKVWSIVLVLEPEVIGIVSGLKKEGIVCVCVWVVTWQNDLKFVWSVFFFSSHFPTYGMKEVTIAIRHAVYAVSLLMHIESLAEVSNQQLSFWPQMWQHTSQPTLLVPAFRMEGKSGLSGVGQ